MYTKLTYAGLIALLSGLLFGLPVLLGVPDLALMFFAGFGLIGGIVGLVYGLGIFLTWVLDTADRLDEKRERKLNRG